MPGSKTPKLPASQIQSWPGCQRRTSSFHSMRAVAALAGEAPLRLVDGGVVLRMPGREDHAAAPPRAPREIVHLGDGRRRRLLQHHVLARRQRLARDAWRTCGGVQIATASRSGRAA